jgi:hypothetical protein
MDRKKVKGKVVPVHTMKTYWRSRSIVLILNLGSRWKWVVNLTFPPSRKYIQHPSNVMLGRPQNWSGHCGKQIRFLPLPEIEPQIVQFIT